MKKIQISDLSVGDWVMVEGEDWKVSAINSDSVGLRVGNDYAMAEISECDGILITPKILEKNGFAVMDKNTWRNAEMGCTVFRYSKKWDIRCRAKKSKYTSVRVDVDNAEFIHQLQHALRLVGVEKEIEL